MEVMAQAVLWRGHVGWLMGLGHWGYCELGLGLGKIMILIQLHSSHILKTKLTAERFTNRHKLDSAAVMAWQSISEEETQIVLIIMGSRLQAVIGFASKFYNNIIFIIYIYI